MSTKPIDFSSLGGKSVTGTSTPAASAPQAGAIDFSSLGGKQVAPTGATPPPGSSSDSPAWDWTDTLAAAGEGTDAGKVIGGAKSLGQTITTVSSLLNKIPGVGELLAPKEGVDKMEHATEIKSATEAEGAGAESILEFMMGDEALKSLSFAQKLSKVAPVMKALEKSPRLMKAIGTAIRQGTLASGQGMLHGQDPKAAAVTGAVTGGTGMLGEGISAGLGSLINKIKPGTTEIAGEVAPKLASQEAGGSPLAKDVATINSEPEIAKAQQEASKRAFGNIATKAAKNSTKNLPAPKPVDTTVTPKDFLERVGAPEGEGVLKTPKDQKTVDSLREAYRQGGKDVPPTTLEMDETGNVTNADGRHRALAASLEGVERIPVQVSRKIAVKAGNFGEASKIVEDAAKPVYEKLNEASGGEFAKLRADRAAAFKRGDFEGAKQAEQGIEDLFANHSKTMESKTGLLDEFGNPLKVTSEEEAIKGISKEELSHARQAWRDSYVLQDLHHAVNGAFNIADEDVAQAAGAWRGVNGGKLMTRLNALTKKVGRDSVEGVIGKDGLVNLYKIADLTQTPENAARFGNVVGDVANAMLPKRGLIGMTLDEARRMVLHSTATNPRVENMIQNAFKSGASKAVYAPLIAREIMRAGDEKDQ